MAQAAGMPLHHARARRYHRHAFGLTEAAAAARRLVISHAFYAAASEMTFEQMPYEYRLLSNFSTAADGRTHAAARCRRDAARFIST